MKTRTIIYVLVGVFFFSACGDNGYPYDASGTFEADAIVVPARAGGIIRAFKIEEGDSLKKGQQVGYIDSTQVYLKKLQLQAQINSILSQRPDISTQMAALREKLAQTLNEQQRITGLYQDDAATDQQLDQINAEVHFLKKKIQAKSSSLHLQTSSLSASIAPLKIQIARLEDQLRKHRIVNPITGTVLMTYVEPHEMALKGKPLYKIANLSHIILRAYITGDQFAQIRLGQSVKVYVDDGHGDLKSYKGSIQWISNTAEFTPKMIQTKKARAHKVYALKIKVKNDGNLKIGMFGQVKFAAENAENK